MVIYKAKSKMRHKLATERIFFPRGIQNRIMFCDNKKMQSKYIYITFLFDLPS